MPAEQTTQHRTPASLTGVVRVRVRYSECDPMNVAHHASYVPWFELARTELLREQGTTYAELERAGVLLVVTELRAGYRRPIAYDDVIEISTSLVHAGRVRLRHAYEVRVAEPADPSRAHNELAATAEIELACCDRSGRPRPLPAELRR